MLMARGHALRDISVKFNVCPTLPCQFQHTLKETSVITVASKPEVGQEGDWKGAFVANVRDKVMDQIIKLKDEALLDTLRLTVHFGVFYGVNTGKVLETTQGGISLPELEAAIVGNKIERRVAERADWGREHVERQRKAALERKEIKMIEVTRGSGCGGGGGGEGSGGGSASSKRARKERRRYLCTSFWSGITLDVKDDTACSTAEGHALAVLKRYGFNEDSSGGTTGPWTWRVQLIPSRSYAVVARLDDEMRVVSVAEKWLNWVHGTLLAGQGRPKEEDALGLLHSHDLRLKLQTRQMVTEQLDLYRDVMGGDGKGPLEIDPTSGKPKARVKKVMFVRHVKSTSLLRGPLGLVAVVAKGEQYEGVNMEGPRPFMELSLETEAGHVREWVKGQRDRRSTSQWLDQVLELIIDVSEAFRNV